MNIVGAVAKSRQTDVCSPQRDLAPGWQALWILSPRVFSLERGIHTAPRKQKYSRGAMDLLLLLRGNLLALK